MLRKIWVFERVTAGAQKCILNLSSHPFTSLQRVSRCVPSWIPLSGATPGGLERLRSGRRSGGAAGPERAEGRGPGLALRVTDPPCSKKGERARDGFPVETADTRTLPPPTISPSKVTDRVGVLVPARPFNVALSAILFFFDPSSRLRRSLQH